MRTFVSFVVKNLKLKLLMGLFFNHTKYTKVENGYRREKNAQKCNCYGSSNGAKEYKSKKRGSLCPEPVRTQRSKSIGSIRRLNLCWGIYFASLGAILELRSLASCAMKNLNEKALYTDEISENSNNKLSLKGS